MKRLKGYENVEHVLTVLEEFHQQLADMFTNIAQNAANERARLVAEYLAERQGGRAGALHAYRQDAPESLLSNWLQIPFPEQPGEFVDVLATSAPQSSEDVHALLRQVDDFSQRLLQHMADRAETANVKALFLELIDMEEQEKRLRSRALVSFSQM